MVSTENPLEVVSIRPARSADLDAILPLNEAAMPHVSFVDRDLFTRFLSAPYFGVICVNEVLAGFVVALGPGFDYDSPNYRWFCDAFPSFLYIDRVVVAAAYQRRGLANRLYDDVETFAIGRAPVVTCEVNTRPRASESLAFHRQRRFLRVGAQDTEQGKKSVALLAKHVGVGPNPLVRLQAEALLDD